MGEANPTTDAVWRRLADDPLLVDYCDVLQTEQLKDRADFRTVRQAYWLSRQHRFFHWGLEFEDVFSRDDPGFDVILGNPPWERIKLQEQEFFAQRDPAIAAAPNSAARKRLIAALPETDPVLFAAYERAKRQSEAESKFLRESGRYPLAGQGDINLYQVFFETGTQSVSSAGFVGLIVPDTFATNSTTAAFFGELVRSGRLRSFLGFKNERFLFPSVDHRFTFALATVGGQRPDTSFETCWYAYTVEAAHDPSRRVPLRYEDLALLNPITKTCPILLTARDAQIAKAIYSKPRVLVHGTAASSISDGLGTWDLKFTTMFHMANDSHLFVTTEELRSSEFDLGDDGRFRRGNEVFVPLYEAKMIHQYDHRFGTYEGQTQAQANQGKPPELSSAQHEDPSISVLPRYWVSEAAVREKAPGQKWLIAFRDVTNATNERTAIFSAMPFAAAGHTLPLIAIDAPPTLRVAFLANANAYILDYVARQNVGGNHLTYFILNQLPVISPDQYSPQLLENVLPRVLELVYTAWDLAPFARDLGYEGDPFIWDEDRRALLRAELDGIYAHLYGLDPDDFDYILGTFPIVNRNDMKQHGEERTRRLCLAAYDYFSKTAREKLRSAIEDIEIHLNQLVIKRLGNDLSKVPEPMQVQMEPEREKQGKPPRATSLSDFMGSGYLTLIGKVIRANLDQFGDMFESNSQVRNHFDPLIPLRNELAHPKEMFISSKVRASGEPKVRWFAEKLGLDIELVPPPAI